MKLKMVNDPLTNIPYTSVKKIIDAHNVSEYLVYSQKRAGKTLKQALEYAIKHTQPKRVIVDPNTGKRYSNYKEMLTAYGIDYRVGADAKYRKGISYEDQVRGLKPVNSGSLEDIHGNSMPKTIKFVPFEDTDNDAINPNHYKSGNMECIDVLKDVLGEEGFKGFCRGNVFKYLWRYNHKNGKEDLLKAKCYLEKLVEVLN